MILVGITVDMSQAGAPEIDPRVPDDVRWKAGYVNPIPPPRDFNSALLWGIAIADTRVPGYQSANVEIVRTRLSCVVEGKSIVVNNDKGVVRGGLYTRQPWFGSNDYHEAMLFGVAGNGDLRKSVVLRVGLRADRVWHFWSASPRAKLPVIVRSFVADGHGLLALSDRAVGRVWGKQSRSGSEQLVLSGGAVAGGFVY